MHWRGDNELRLSYALCVVRAVNGLVDPQQQSYFAGSVLALAAKIGIPGWIVELRHDATHSDLPSLSVLRHAVQTILAWYDVNYWRRQAEYLRSISVSIQRHSLANEEASNIGSEADGANEKKSLAVSSFSHIVIPQLVNDVAFFEMDPQKDNKLFEVFISKPVNNFESWRQKSLEFIRSSRWCTSVDDVLAAAPEWGCDGLIGHMIARIYTLIRSVAGADHTSEAGKIAILLCEWKMFILVCLLTHVLSTFQCGELKFSSTIYSHQRRRCKDTECIMLSYMDAVCLKLCASNSMKPDAAARLSGKRVFQASADTKKDSKRLCGTESLVDVISGSQKRVEYIFEPVLWPLGSMPGDLNTMMYSVEDCTVALQNNEKYNITSEIL